jgi:hypothetical protein
MDRQVAMGAPISFLDQPAISVPDCHLGWGDTAWTMETGFYSAQDRSSIKLTLVKRGWLAT